MLGEFYESTSKVFDATISLSGVNPDISGDTVKLIIKKDINSTSVLEASADVITDGVNGVAKFNITPAEMSMNAGSYYAFLMWYNGSNKYILKNEMIRVFEGVTG